MVNDLDDGDHQRVLGGARLRGLQLLDGGEDEGEGGHHDHEEADEGHDLGKLARPRVLERVPGPGPPLQTQNTHKTCKSQRCCYVKSKHLSTPPHLSYATAAEILLVRELHLELLGGDVSVLLALADVNLGVVLQGAAGLHRQLVNAPVLQVLLQHQGAAALRHVEHPLHKLEYKNICRNNQNIFRSTFCIYFMRERAMKIFLTIIIIISHAAIHVEDSGEVLGVPVEEVLGRLAGEELLAVAQDLLHRSRSDQLAQPGDRK